MTQDMNRKVLLFATTVAALVMAFIIRRVGLRKTAVGDRALPASEALTLLATSMRDAREATIAAFAEHADDAEFTQREMTARGAFEKAQGALAELRDALPPSLREPCDRFIECASEAQLQLMAFAINRKNRGTPDSGQEAVESHDLNHFRAAVKELHPRLTSAFDAVGVSMA